MNFAIHNRVTRMQSKSWYHNLNEYFSLSLNLSCLVMFRDTEIQYQVDEM